MSAKEAKSNKSKGEPLSSKAKRHLRALGHHRKAIVLVGKTGVTDGLIDAAAIALDDHELIKIKLGENADGDRHELIEALAEGTGAEVVGVVGRTGLLYKRNPEKPKIAMPSAKAAKKKAAE